MRKVEPVQVLNIDDQALKVEDLSDTVKQLVAVFDDWNQTEADARDHLAMVSAARETLTRQIVQQVRSDFAKEAAKAEEAAKVEEAAKAEAVDTIANTEEGDTDEATD